MADMNSVNITGNLTRDPELKTLPSGTTVCELGVACNGRKKQGDQWVDDPNFFDVTVFGAQGENAAAYLAKGRKVGVSGRLDWQSWEDKNGGGKRSKVKIIANSVVFLTPKPDGEQGQAQAQHVQIQPATTVDVPGDAEGLPPQGGTTTAQQDDDIPF